jgi:type VI secretion system secreted protein VgrG
MPITQQNRETGILTPLGDDVLLLRDMDMTEELGRLFTIDLELLSLTENIAFEELLGQKVTIRLNLPNTEKRYFIGNVSRFSQAGNQGSFAVYQATVRPWLWFLTRTSDCRIFQQKTVPDIIKEVFREHGYTDFEERLSGSYRTWDCVQYRETDFNFVSRLMEQEGIYYYFKHEQDKHTLILSDSSSSHEAIPGYETIPYYPPGDTTVREEEFISSWNISKQVQTGVYALNDYDFKKPKADLKVSSTIPRDHSSADFEVYDYPGEYIETDHGDAYARARIEELHAQYEQAQGQSDARGMMCGALFKLSEYPREDQNREYLVVTATHDIHSDDFESDGGGGGPVYSNTFSAIESKTPFRAVRTTPKPIVQGLQTAMVVGPSGEEIYTDEHGRVKLQFHWDRYGKSDENSSCWVRVAQLWAGKTWGGIHIPRIGQEVIVEFLEGDPDRPIITGRVYNADEMPPYELPANKTQSGIKSRSSQEGSGDNSSEIRMEDKKGEEQLYIHAEKNQDNIVENDETTSVGHDRTEAVGSNETITIGNDRTESVGNNETITIGNSRIEQVGVNETVTIGSNRSVTIGSNKTETIAINKAETIGAAKELTIGGLYQVSVGGVMNETVALAKAQEVGATKATVVIGNVSENYNSSQTTEVSNDHTESIGKNQSISVGENQTTSVNKDQAVTVGKNLSIDAGDQIVIKTGKASITMKKDGTITIKGKDISVDGAGKIDVKASNNITMKGQKILQN